MNCPNCKEPLSYRFTTTCESCGFHFPERERNAQDQTGRSNQQNKIVPLRLSWSKRLANVAIVMVVSFLYMLTGALVSYVVGGIVYLAIYGGEIRNSEECARGMAFGFLSILTGAIFGVVIGIVFSVRTLTFKPARTLGV